MRPTVAIAALAALPLAAAGGDAARDPIGGDAVRSVTSGDAVRAAAGGNAARGAAIAASRSEGLCVLCHALPGVPAAQSGTLGPSLAGVGSRFTRDELRERLVAPECFNPATLMPSVSRTEGLTRVAAARRGKPLLDAQQIDDVVEYLATSK